MSQCSETTCSIFVPKAIVTVQQCFSSHPQRLSINLDAVESDHDRKSGNFGFCDTTSKKTLAINGPAVRDSRGSYPVTAFELCS
jgi:hypothetical protein